MDFLTDTWGEFSLVTGELALIMGFGNKSEPEPKDVRPETRGDAIRLIEKIYDFNRWGKREIETNCAMIGVPYFPKVSDYSTDDLKKILDDMEFYKMIIFTN